MYIKFTSASQLNRPVHVQNYTHRNVAFPANSE